MTIEDDYESEADRNVDEGYEEGDQIRDRPRHVAARHGPEEERVEAPVYETVVHRGVQPQEREQDGGHGQGAGVDDPGGGPLGALQVVGEQGGGEGYKGHAHQKQYVQEEQYMVRARDKVEAIVVVGLDHADLEEADHVREVGRPLLDERPEERRLFTFDVRNPNSMTSSVIAIANTPSLKASILPVSLSWPADMLTS